VVRVDVAETRIRAIVRIATEKDSPSDVQPFDVNLMLIFATVCGRCAPQVLSWRSLCSTDFDGQNALREKAEPRADPTVDVAGAGGRVDEAETRIRAIVRIATEKDSP
jgi:hypothetical protein